MQHGSHWLSYYREKHSCDSDQFRKVFVLSGRDMSDIEEVHTEAEA